MKHAGKWTVQREASLGKRMRYEAYTERRMPSWHGIKTDVHVKIPLMNTTNAVILQKFHHDVDAHDVLRYTYVKRTDYFSQRGVEFRQEFNRQGASIND